MITIGKTNELNVVKKVDFGFYLDAQEVGEVLLPRRYAPVDLPVVTTQKAKAQVGEFAYLKVLAVTDIGAFLDWGLDKDVLVPFAEQHRPMEVGHSYLVHIYIGKADGRITASSKIDKFVDDEAPHHFKPGQAVDLIIANSSDLGYKAIINHSHWGVLYKDEVFQRLSFGQSIQGYIKRIRDDGKIDLSLQGGQETRDKNQKIIFDYLKNKMALRPCMTKRLRT